MLSSNTQVLPQSHMAATPPRTTIFLGHSLRSLRAEDPAKNFSARLESAIGRYQAILADLMPKTLSVDDWKALLPILKATTFDQPGDAFLLPLRLKSAGGGTLAYKLEGMKLGELLAIIEAGQAFLANHPTPSDDAIREHLKARA